jgi:hypothetical protein
VFAVCPPEHALRLGQGYKRLFWRDSSGLVCETITRARTPVSYPLVFVAVDPQGRIVTEQA